MLPTAIRHNAPFHSEGSSWVVSTLAIVQKRKQWICLLWWFFRPKWLGRRSWKHQLSGWDSRHFLWWKNVFFPGSKVESAWHGESCEPWRWFMLILKLLPFSTHDWKPTGQRNHTWLPSQVYLSHLLLDPSHLLLCRKTRWSSVDSRDRRDWLNYLPGVGHSHHYHTHTHTELVSNHSKNQKTKGKENLPLDSWTFLCISSSDLMVEEKECLLGLSLPWSILLYSSFQTPPSHPESNIFIDRGHHQNLHQQKGYKWL